jgi:hypothetical protein
VARRARRWHWIGSSGASSRQHHDDRTGIARRVAMRWHDARTDLSPDRHAIDAQMFAGTIVCLYQRTDHEGLARGHRHARRSAGAALELVADHPRATADIALPVTMPRSRSLARGISDSFHAVRDDTGRACSNSQSRNISRRGGGSTASGTVGAHAVPHRSYQTAGVQLRLR